MPDIFDLIEHASHPSFIQIGYDQEGIELIMCPECGEVGTLEDMDGMGADEDCAFCIGCQLELLLPWRCEQ